LNLYSNTEIENKVLKVSEINKILKVLIESMPKINVRGEIAEITIHNSGNIYLKIKDEESQLECTIFKNRMKEEFLKFKKGDEIIVSGYLYLFIKGGRYSLNVYDVKKEGKGKIYEEYIKLLEKLSKEGLFDKKYKKNIPFIPKKIGIITSIDGAALRDILNITNKRFNSIDIVIYPAKVQGENSSESLIEAIKAANIHNDVDVIILARGGGSYEDLISFNDESLAREIFNSKIPIISAVGHEIDYTISDHVADVRASTPSHAAEIVVPNKSDIINHINQIFLRIESKLNEKLRIIKDRIENSNEERIRRIIDKKLEDSYRELDFISTRLESIINTKIKDFKNKLDLLQLSLEKLNPLYIMNRGYSITYYKDKPITSIKSVKPEEIIETRLMDGFLVSKIEKITS